MSGYQLEIEQIVDYPRCRMYREFVQTLIADRSIHTRGCSGLFHFLKNIAATKSCAIVDRLLELICV